MANSKNTKKDRDEKKSGDLSELNEGYPSYGTAGKSNSETAGLEFTSKYSSSFDEEENDYPTSAYASKINKSYGESTKKKTREEDDDDYSYTSQLGNDQRSGRTHQLSYDQQFRYQQQQPSQYQQQYKPSYNQSNQPQAGRQYGNPNFQQGQQPQGYTHQDFNQRPLYQHQPFGYQQRYSNPYPQGQEPYAPQGYAQNYQNPGSPVYGPSYGQPQGFNQAYNYGNQFGNQQFVNRGYENHNYNDQSNRLRSSFNTQGFGDSIYRHESYHPEAGGSGYAGSTFGGHGTGEFRSNPYDYNQPYGNPSFPTHRQEFRNPSRGYNRNYRLDEERRNDYQHDEDGIKGYQNEYPGNFESGYTSPYGNEREEQFGYEREYSQHGRSQYNPNRDFEDRNFGHNFERSYGPYERSNRKSRNRRRH